MDAAPLLSLKLVAAILMTQKVSLIAGASNDSGNSLRRRTPTGELSLPEFFCGGSMFNLLQMC